MNHLSAVHDRTKIIVPGNKVVTIKFCVNQFIEKAQKAINQHQYFAVALSGGGTPKAIFEQLLHSEESKKIDWTRVLLFWGDERCVPKTDTESNYKMAMDAAFSHLPIPKTNIFPMEGTGDLEQNARNYEKLILEKIPGKRFDLVMLGVGEDGHTASLFPKTHALHSAPDRLVVANFVPQKDVWRMTLTYKCINEADSIEIYVLGKSKAEIVHRIFTSSYNPDLLPVQKIGTVANKAIWIMDEEVMENRSQWT